MPHKTKKPRESNFTVPPPWRTDIDPDAPFAPAPEPPFRGSLRVGTALSDAVRTTIVAQDRAGT